MREWLNESGRLRWLLAVGVILSFWLGWQASGWTSGDGACSILQEEYQYALSDGYKRVADERHGISELARRMDAGELVGGDFRNAIDRRDYEILLVAVFIESGLDQRGCSIPEPLPTVGVAP